MHRRLLTMFGWACLLFSILLFSIYKVIVLADRTTKPYSGDSIAHLESLKDRLYQHVWFLSEEIGERHNENQGSLEKTINYITQEFNSAGYNPELQNFGPLQNSNIIAEITGTDNEVLIIGAHYDTVWLSPGADDNATGIAGLLEIARALSGSSPVKTIRFIAFANEEQPYSHTDDMGSRVYARSVNEKNENIVGMISLEMLGYYSDEPGGQKFPSLAHWFYPDTASFIGFISNLQSRKFLLSALNHYRTGAIVPAEGLAIPVSLVPDIQRSDHASFWTLGYPAIMITDTANFRNINYHSVGDVIHTLDFNHMVGVVSGLIKMTAALASQ